MKSIDLDACPVIHRGGKRQRLLPFAIMILCAIAACRQSENPPSPSIALSFTAAVATDTRPELRTASSSPTRRRTPTRTLPPPTQTASIAYPPNFEQISAVTGIEPDELMALYTTIHDALGANDPKPLAELVHYPMIGCNRCGGLVIETPEDFIKAYPDLMDEETRLRLYEQKPEDLSGSWRGVMFGSGEIWLSGLCEGENYQSCGTYIIKFMSYCQYWYDPKSSFPLSVDASNFVFGRYTVESYTTVGGTMLTEEDIKEIVNSKIDIFPSRYLADPSGWFGNSCQSALMEFCPAFHDAWNDPSSIGRLTILCENEIVRIFDIFSVGRISLYLDGHIFYLDHLKT